MQRPSPLQNCHFRSKNKIAINMQKTTPKEHKNSSTQKTTPPKSKYFQNGTIFVERKKQLQKTVNI